MPKIRVALLLLASLLFSLIAYPVSSGALNASSTFSISGTIINQESTPLVGGWGGARLSETVRYTEEAINSPRASPQSVVFNGEVASNAEMEMLYMKNHGWNAVRAYWEAPYRQQSAEWGYNSTWLNRMITIAEALGMYIIVDCHGYYDASENFSLWMSTWAGIISQFKNSYSGIIWEPLNEPLEPGLAGASAVSALQTQYQAWIDQARNLGDTHWIIVSGIEFGNSQPDMVNWFPAVNDQINRVFYNWHYYFYFDDESSDWTIAAAQAKADAYFNAITQLIAKYNRPFLCTEMGAQSHTGSAPPPDLQYDKASGYSTVSLAFVQRLVTDFDNCAGGRIGYMLWTGETGQRTGISVGITEAYTEAWMFGEPF